MAIVCNIGHFDNEIQVEGAEELQVGQHQAAGRRDRVPGWQAHHPAVGRPPCEPGQRHGPPVVRDVGIFTNQTLAQIELWTKRDTGEYKNEVYAAKAPRREGCAPAPQEDRRRTDGTERRAGQLHRRAATGPLQARALPLLEPKQAGRARDKAVPRDGQKPFQTPAALRPRVFRFCWRCPGLEQVRFRWNRGAFHLKR
jgi:hypothetical protein